MCGIFGIIGIGNGPISIKALKSLAVNQERRGPHSFGFAWIDKNNRVRHFKTKGRISQQTALLNVCRHAKAVIGHTRYATHGDVDNNVNNHPHPSDGGWIVHNGVIGNHSELADDYGMMLNSECDSEVLGQMIELNTGNLTNRCKKSVNEVDTTYPLCFAGLWKGYIAVAKRGNPLQFSRSSKGNIMFGSVGDMPGKRMTCKDNQLFIFNLNAGTFKSTELSPHTGNRRVAGSGSTMAKHTPCSRSDVGDLWGDIEEDTAVEQACLDDPTTRHWNNAVEMFEAQGNTLRAEALRSLAGRTGVPMRKATKKAKAKKQVKAKAKPKAKAKAKAKAKPKAKAKRTVTKTSAKIKNPNIYTPEQIENMRKNGRPIRTITRSKA